MRKLILFLLISIPLFAQPGSKIGTKNIAINVKDYGAKGDGSTNDSTAIQNAIDAAYGGLTKMVFFPKGTYMVQGDIHLKRQVTMYGSNPRNVIIRFDSTSGTIDTALVKVVEHDVGAGNYIYGCRLQGMTLDARGSSKPALIVVAAQENNHFGDLVLRGTAGVEWALKVQSYGAYTGGTASTTPTHQAQFSDLQILDGKGILIQGVHHTKFERITVDGDANGVNDTAIVLRGYAPSNRFENIHLEDFGSPIVVESGDNNTFDNIKANVTAYTLGANKTLFEVDNGVDNYTIRSLSDREGYRYIWKDEDAAGDTINLSGVGNIAYIYSSISGGVKSYIRSDKVVFSQDVQYKGTQYQTTSPLDTTSTTPSVGSRNLYFWNKVTPVTITDFSDELGGKIITVLFTTAGSIISHNANIALRDGNADTTSAGDVYQFLYNSNKWYEIR